MGMTQEGGIESGIIILFVNNRIRNNFKVTRCSVIQNRYLIEDIDMEGVKEAVEMLQYANRAAGDYRSNGGSSYGGLVLHLYRNTEEEDMAAYFEESFNLVDLKTRTAVNTACKSFTVGLKKKTWKQHVDNLTRTAGMMASLHWNKEGFEKDPEKFRSLQHLFLHSVISMHVIKAHKDSDFRQEIEKAIRPGLIRRLVT